MSSNNNFQEKPEWFHQASITETFDAREILQAGQHPLAEVLRRTAEMEAGQVFELITPFPPKPLIEKVNASGFTAYVLTVAESEIHTFFRKD